MENEKNKKYLWIYAVILFLSAFTVLLITAFSQFKLNNNLENAYKQNAEKEKGYNFTLTAANKEKKDLIQRIQELESENSTLKSSVTVASNQAQSVAIQRAKASFDYIIKANVYFKEERNLDCAEAVSKAFPEDLGEQALIRYEYLKSRVYPSATRKYRNEARDYLDMKSYKKAKECFEKVLTFDTEKKYEESTLYNLYFTNMKLEIKEKADSYKQQLIKGYPNSEYAKKVQK